MIRSAPYVPDYEILKRLAFRRALRVGLIVAAMFLVAGLGLWAWSRDATAFAVLAAFAIIFAPLFAFRVRQANTAALTNPKHARAYGARSFWFDDERFGWDTEMGVSSQVVWTFLDSWREERGSFVLELFGPQLVLVPQRAFTPEGVNALRERLTQAAA